jgi:TPR repeat protein
MNRYFLAIQEAANMDLLVAQFYLGLCYRRGRGVAIDKSRGEELIREAADRGLMRARINLAWRRILRIYNPLGFAYGLIKLPLLILEFLTIAAIDPDDERLR